MKKVFLGERGRGGSLKIGIRTVFLDWVMI
jgi:hypothetical protein